MMTCLMTHFSRPDLLYPTVFVLMAAVLVLGCSGADNLPVLPDTPKERVTDEYHGTVVSEDYRWLEDFDNPAVEEWSDAQNEYARYVLNRLPHRNEIHRRLIQLNAGGSPEYYSMNFQGGILFALKSQPPHEQPFLVVFDNPDQLRNERIILDLNTLNPDATTCIDFYVPSHDARLVAVSLSEEGSEMGDVYIYDVATGEQMDDMVPGVNGPTAGGDVAWLADGSGFFYTRYPRSGERPEEDLRFYQQVWFHQLGSPEANDTYQLGEEFPRIAEIEFEVSDDGAYFLAAVANGDGGEFAHYLLKTGGDWQQITRFEDMISHIKFAPDNSLYMLSTKNAPKGQILRLVPGTSKLSKATLIVKESQVSIKDFLPTESRLYTIDLAGGPNQIRVFSRRGNPLPAIPVKPVSSVYSPLWPGGDDLFYFSQSYVDPGAWYRYRASTEEVERTDLYETAVADLKDIQVTRNFALSKDGTPVPMNILHPVGIDLDGSNPAILTGYGGFGISRSPGFDDKLRLWFDHGGVYVIANLRGGGEFGEEWHQGGCLTRKQNVFDDFIACARHLIDSGYTNPEKLAIRGGSNGGLLMGAVMTQAPELFKAVVARAGIYDMLRVELDPNGQFNVTEYGTVTDPEQFVALYGYSPYHHVVDGTKYPAVLFTAGLHDGRVNPMQSRKMIARLQAASASDEPLLLRTSSTSGHGKGTSRTERIETEADVYAFIFDRLGIKYQR